MRRSLLIPIFAAALAACGGGKNTSPADAGVPDGPPAGPPDAACFTNPHTHYEIINACTNAQAVDKHPNLPLLLPDGGLPPLPQ
jgi:hypothetical protein